MRSACIVCALSLGASSADAGAQSGLEDLARPRTEQVGRVTSAQGPLSSNDDGQTLASGAEVPLAELDGPGEIRHLWISYDSVDPYAARYLVLRAFWDGELQPSVEVPVGDFFAVGHALERDVDSSPVQVVGDGRSRHCYWPMPFDRSARLMIRNDSQFPVRVLLYHVDWCTQDQPRGEELRTFHACYRQTLPRENVREHVVADIRGRGHYVGTSLALVSGEDGWPGEGDDRFLIDGDPAPLLSGTGTEDYFGDAFGWREFQRPSFGVVVHEGSSAGARSSAYRWHLADPMVFSRSLQMTFEKLGVAKRDGRWSLATNRADAFASVAFWYQSEPHHAFAPLPAPAERLPFFERRIELENVLGELQVVRGAPRPTRQEGRFWSMGAQVFLAAATVETARLSVPFRVDEAGEFDLLIRLTAAPDHGLYQVQVDGEARREPIDLFRERTMMEEIFLGRMALAAGEHRLEFLALGKNPRSSGYHLGVDSIMLRWQ